MEVIDVDVREVMTGAAPDVTALVVTPHPLTLHGQRLVGARAAALVPGETLAVFLDRHGVKVGQQWAVSIGGAMVPEAMWDRVRPKHGHLVEAHRVPQREVLKLVAIVALSYFTFGLGGLAGGSFLGLTGTAATIAATAAFVAGSMVINKLLGPKPLTNASALNSVSPTYALTGARNRARPFEPLALVLGEPYAAPDLAAQPYTYFYGGEQYLWQIFNCGINCSAINSLRIGQTDISTYQGVTLNYTGFASGNTGLPLLGTSVDSTAGALLDAVTAPGAYVTRTSSLATLVLAVDLECSLFSVDSKGAYRSLSCNISLEYRAVGSGTWLPFLGASSAITLENASTKPLRLTYELSVATGQYEVRARKETANETGSTAQNTVTWTVLKSYQADTGSYSGQARLGVRIQASGQLNGALDDVNCRLVAKPHSYWNGSAWVYATSRANGLSNPGAIILMLARGLFDDTGRLIAGLGFSDSQIDVEGLKLFMVRCAAKGFTFDWFVQETVSIGDLLDTVAAAGMGTICWPDGKLGVMWFAENQPVEGVVNMATMKAKSFSVSYDTMPTAEEIEFQYFDRNRGDIWQSLRVLAPGVTIPTSTARQQLQGVTTEAHAAVLARFSMAQNIYQRKTVSVEVDLEHMTFRRGTVLALSHDVTQWGFGGRVRGAVNASGTVTLTLDEVVPAVSPGGATSRYIGLRIPGESQYRIFPVATFTGSSRTVTLGSAWPGGVPVPGDSAGNPAEDTVWIYDFKSTPGQKLRVAGLSPVGNLDGARVALVPETDEFWTYVNTGSYAPPPNNSSLAQSSPVASNLRVTEQLERQGNTFFVELTASWDVAGYFGHAELFGAVADSSDTPLSLLGSTRGKTVSWRGGLDQVWRLEVRLYSDIRASAAAPLTGTYTVVGLAFPPENYNTFALEVKPDGTRVFTFAYTTTPVPVDLAGGVIRYTAGLVASPSWGSMTPLNDGIVAGSPLETVKVFSGDWTFALKARDTTGNESLTPLYIQQSLPISRLGDAVATFDDKQLGWPGAKTACVATLGMLEASNSATWATFATWSAWSRWNALPGNTLSYVATCDLGAVLTAQINVELSVHGTYVLDMATSNDGVTYGAWGDPEQQFVGRYVRVRVVVTKSVAQPIARIVSMKTTAHATVKKDVLNDVNLATYSGRIGVGRVLVPTSMQIVKQFGVVIQDARNGQWSWVKVARTSQGVQVNFFLDGKFADPDLADFYIEGF